MKTRLTALLQRPGIRYIVVGGSVYVIEIIIILVAQKLGANAVVAVGISFWLGFVISFVLQKFMTFSDKRLHHKVLLPQVIAVALLVLFNFGFTILVTNLLYHKIPAAVARTGALGVTTIWNFYLYRTKIFRNAEVEEIGF